MTRRLLLAVAIVCVTNVGALVLAVVNRGAASAPRTLTERELRLDIQDRESTAISLHLVIARPIDEEWLDRAKLESLGFDCSVSPEDSDASTWYRRQLPREVLIVLEFDGPAWVRHRAAIERGHEHRVLPGDAPAAQTVDPGQARRVIDGHTRLFAVDAGTDHGALRAKYPDGARYLITYGQVDLRFLTRRRDGRDEPYLSGAVVGLTPQDISVPREYARVLAPLREAGSSYYGEWLDRPVRYAVTLRYGRFLMPWVTAVQTTARP